MHYYGPKNNKWSRTPTLYTTHKDFVSQAVSELADSGTIEVCKNRPVVVSPLTVSVQSNDKKRLILDLGLVNE